MAVVKWELIGETCGELTLWFCCNASQYAQISSWHFYSFHCNKNGTKSRQTRILVAVSISHKLLDYFHCPGLLPSDLRWIAVRRCMLILCHTGFPNLCALPDRLHFLFRQSDENMKYASACLQLLSRQLVCLTFQLYISGVNQVARWYH